ncbi:MAG: hypothetical protein R2911_28390 [Caldilineaceae bacterium]
MFSKLFRHTDERDINQLIYDYAEYGRRRDYARIIKKLPLLTLYSTVRSTNAPIYHGMQHVTQPGDQIAIQAVNVPGYGKMVLFFADQRNPRLGSPYIGTPFAEACKMSMLAPDSVGVMIYNDKESYIGLPHFHLLEILRQLAPVQTA